MFCKQCVKIRLIEVMRKIMYMIFDGRFIILTRRSAKLILTHLKKIPRLVQALGDIITR